MVLRDCTRHSINDSLGLKFEPNEYEFRERESKSTDVVNDTSLQHSRDIGRGLDERADRDGSNSLEICLRGSRNVCAEVCHRLCLCLLDGLGLHVLSPKSA